METQKIVNLLNDIDNKNSKFATKKWYVIDNESKGNYSHKNPVKFLTIIYKMHNRLLLMMKNILILQHIFII